MFNSISWTEFGFERTVDEVSGFGVMGMIVEKMEVQASHMILIALISYIVLIAAAYFIGNISPSTLLAKSRGLDIKKEGSGNAGTTNALRVMGKKAGVITMVIDILKGVVAVLLGTIIAGTGCGQFCAVAVVAGHVWPAIYRFQGGKGVATTFGALLAINPLLAVIVLLVVAIAVYISKIMSVGSEVGALSFPVLCFILEPGFIVHGTVLAVIVLVKHRANIQRLFRGEEPKLSFLDKEKKETE